MESIGTRAFTVHLVGAPAAFAERLAEAVPEAAIVAVAADAAIDRSGARDLAIIFLSDVLDWARVLCFTALGRTVIVAERPRPADALTTLENGADGYLDAAIDTAALRGAVLGVLHGELAYGREVIGLSLRSPQRASAPRSTITPRQREILDLIASGATDKEIATAMGLRTTTVQKTVGRLLRRLGVRNRAAAVALRALAPIESRSR